MNHQRILHLSNLSRQVPACVSDKKKPTRAGVIGERFRGKGLLAQLNGQVLRGRSSQQIALVVHQSDWEAYAAKACRRLCRNKTTEKQRSDETKVGANPVHDRFSLFLIR